VSPAPMHLGDRPAVGLTAQAHLALQPIDVRDGNGMILFDDDVTTAIQTEPFAKWM
jgi:hypothetical protein